MKKLPRLKVYMEQPGFGVGCVELEYGEEEMKSFPMADVRHQVGELLVKIKENYKDRLELDLVDPRNIVALKDVLLLGIKSTEVTWVLNRKVIFRGVPDWDTIKKAIDQALQ
ncbi:MAG: hypothetical protein PWR00_1269 [Thermovirga sp.]|jgi:hypothetical protein|nr:hypothetical protein [Thermovirga sp.]